MQLTCPCCNAHYPLDAAMADTAAPRSGVGLNELLAWRALRMEEKWQCDLGNGEFDHDWEVIHDWEGDPGVIGGTRDICYLRCQACGAEDYDIDPSDYAPDPEDWVD